MGKGWYRREPVMMSNGGALAIVPVIGLANENEGIIMEKTGASAR